MSESNNLTFLYDHSKDLAQAVVDTYYSQYPDIKDQYGAEGYRKSIQDAEYHFLYLAEAVATKEPRLFLDYLNWTRTLFHSINLPISLLERTLLLMKNALQSRFNNEMVQSACGLIDNGLSMLAQEPVVQTSYIDGSNPLDMLARSYLQALLQGDRKKAGIIIGDAVQNGISIKDIYIQVFQRTQQELGRLWHINKITVAQEHYCTAATQMIMSQLYPFIFSGEIKERHIVIACVGGELHEIGARMVADIFEIEGWDSYFIGANTPLKDLLHTIRAKKLILWPFQ
jgi:methanogenic corrinoid protein MtbC1